MLLTWNRWKHFAAMALIGDGVVAMLYPQRDAKTWSLGPRPWREAMQELNEHRGLTRVLGAIQTAAVLCLVLGGEREK
jgi:hypothetical protein